MGQVKQIGFSSADRYFLIANLALFHLNEVIPNF
jgi:hypothetical protein